MLLGMACWYWLWLALTGFDVVCGKANWLLRRAESFDAHESNPAMITLQNDRHVAYLKSPKVLKGNLLVNRRSGPKGI